jgi:hypothetical protein
LLAELQAAMRDALLDLDGVGPPGIVADGVSTEERFEIYRKSVILSLEACLADAFPATEQLLGRLWFRPAARAFARNFPPRAPQLSVYGAEFPAFLAANGAFDVHEAAPDLAQLEWARLTAYFAADAPMLEIDLLARLSPEEVETLRLPLHPSFRLQTLLRPEPAVLSTLIAFGAADIRQGAGKPAVGSFALRAGGKIILGLAEAGEFALLSAFAEGASLNEGADRAWAEDPSFDLQSILSRHLQIGTFTAAG